MTKLGHHLYYFTVSPMDCTVKWFTRILFLKVIGFNELYLWSSKRYLSVQCEFGTGRNNNPDFMPAYENERLIKIKKAPEKSPMCVTYLSCE